MTAPIQSSWVGPKPTATTGAAAVAVAVSAPVKRDPSVPATSTPGVVTESPTIQQQQQQQQQQSKEPFYALVVDSGVIVKSSGEIITKLRGVARRYVCPYGVIEEIRDSRSRQALQQAQALLNLTPRQPTSQSIERVIDFAKQTGDFPSLSTVDIHVLALTLDMEREGCIASADSAATAAAAAASATPATEDSTGVGVTTTTTTLQSAALLKHIRTTPKRTLGLGKITQLNNNTKTTSTATPTNTTTDKTNDTVAEDDGTNNKNSLLDPSSVEGGNDDEEGTPPQGVPSPDASMFILDDDDFDDDDEEDDDDEQDQEEEDDVDAVQPQKLQGDGKDDGATPPFGPLPTQPASNESNITKDLPPRSWAALVNPNATSITVAMEAPASTGWASSTSLPTATDKNMSGAAASMDTTNGGQFDDADDEDIGGGDRENADTIEDSLEVELEKDFPSLAAASTVPYTEHDDDDDVDVDQKDNSHNDVAVNGNDIVEKDINDGENIDLDDQNNDDPAKNSGLGLFERTDAEKKRALKPVSKSGRLYNTLGKYKKLALPTKQLTKSPNKLSQVNDKDEGQQKEELVEASASIQDPNGPKTKILTTSLAETMEENDDDGEGWISSVSGIRSSSMNFGSSAGTKFVDNTSGTGNESQQSHSTNSTLPPPRSCRSACTTTDFAMQNVLLQMNLLLWSAVDGMEIKRLKTWVIRCGVCYKVHPADDQFEGRIKRMFCSHCGSGDMMQRVSASVDGKTGRLKLHFSRKSAVRQKHANARGTKFSLPKAGTHNRFQGDLLLREDQLLMGAWNQKMKIKTGRKQSLAKAESIFGKDLSTSVGGAPNAYSPDDIRVGFGAPRRNNPNSAKGRERRGKKKKSSDRACGMRRY